MREAGWHTHTCTHTIQHTHMLPLLHRERSPPTSSSFQTELSSSQLLTSSPPSIFPHRHMHARRHPHPPPHTHTRTGTQAHFRQIKSHSSPAHTLSPVFKKKGISRFLSCPSSPRTPLFHPLSKHLTHTHTHTSLHFTSPPLPFHQHHHHHHPSSPPPQPALSHSALCWKDLEVPCNFGAGGALKSCLIFWLHKQPVCVYVCEYVSVCMHAHVSVCFSVCSLLWGQVLTCLYILFATISSVVVFVCVQLCVLFTFCSSVCVCVCVRVREQSNQDAGEELPLWLYTEAVS